MWKYRQRDGYVTGLWLVEAKQNNLPNQTESGHREHYVKLNIYVKQNGWKVLISPLEQSTVLIEPKSRQIFGGGWQYIHISRCFSCYYQIQVRDATNMETNTKTELEKMMTEDLWWLSKDKLKTLVELIILLQCFGTNSSERKISDNWNDLFIRL